MDAALASYWNAVLDHLIVQPFGIFIGARPQTQALDIAHALQLVVERGLDDGSRAVLAQCDIQTFFDELHVLKICRWLVGCGHQAKDVACLLRCQMMPRVFLDIGAGPVRIDSRAIGGLTGSRTALMLARVPVETTLRDRSPIWKEWGFFNSPKF